MMAFFDSLVQREIEGWGSEDPASDEQNLGDTKNPPTLVQAQNDSDSNGTSSNLFLFFSFSMDLSSKPLNLVNLSTDSTTATARTVVQKVLNASARVRMAEPGGLAPQRLYDPPNRITRLINNSRKKLMRLAAVEAGTQSASPASFNVVNKGFRTPEAVQPSDTEDIELDTYLGDLLGDESYVSSDVPTSNDNADNNDKENNGDEKSAVSAKRAVSNQNESCIKGVKLKSSTSGGRTRGRRKCVVFDIKIPSNTDSRPLPQMSLSSTSATPELAPSQPARSLPIFFSDSDTEYYPADFSQPSTSSGLRSHRSAYLAPLIVNNISKGSDSDSDSDENLAFARPKRMRMDARGNSRPCIVKSPTSSKTQMSECNKAAKLCDKVNGGAAARSVETLTERLLNKRAALPTANSGFVSPTIFTLEKYDTNWERAQKTSESSDVETEAKNLECVAEK